jgi:N-methylhydantoinase A
VATRVAIDIGGTFTDLVHLDEATGAVDLGKGPTTPAQFEDGVLHVLDESDLEGVRFLAHGTTVVIRFRR